MLIGKLRRVGKRAAMKTLRLGPPIPMASRTACSIMQQLRNVAGHGFTEYSRLARQKKVAKVCTGSALSDPMFFQYYPILKHVKGDIRYHKVTKRLKGI